MTTKHEIECIEEQEQAKAEKQHSIEQRDSKVMIPIKEQQHK